MSEPLVSRGTMFYNVLMLDFSSGHLSKQLTIISGVSKGISIYIHVKLRGVHLW